MVKAVKMIYFNQVIFKVKMYISQKRGTSLLEVMLVIVLLGILTSIVYPKMGGNREYYMLESTARNLAVHMRRAQSHAITASQRTQVAFFTNFYYVELSGEREWITIPEKINIVYNNFPEQFNIRTLSFNNLGAPNKGGRIAFENEKGDRLYVIVTPVTGRVRIGSEAP